MRAEVYAAWRRIVALEAGNTFPGFMLDSTRERGEPRGLMKFVWHARPTMWCYIAFRPVESEAFDAWVGWSDTGRYPGSTRASAAPASDPFDVDAASFIALSMDLVPRAGLAHWNFWNPSEELLSDPELFARAHMQHFGTLLSPKEAEALVQPAVKTAMKEVAQFGLPYLRARASRQ